MPKPPLVSSLSLLPPLSNPQPPSLVALRGNARARQGRIAEALADYNASIALCPWSVDPVLNRGVALEQIGRLQEARRCVVMGSD